MGLDFSHCDVHWAYRGFMRFRYQLAQYYNIDLMKMEGYQWDNTIRGRSWESVNCPLEVFFLHPDCDGELSVEEMTQIVPELEKILLTWDEDDTDRIKGLRLVEGMKHAISLNEPLEFC